SFGFSSGRGSSPRTGPNTLCCGRSCSIASMMPASRRYPRLAWERRYSRETPDATFPQLSRPCASSGCRSASGPAHRTITPPEAPWRARTGYDEGEVLDLLVQRRPNKAPAVKLMRKLLKKQGFAPNVLVTDKLRSYGAASPKSDCRLAMRQG